MMVISCGCGGVGGTRVSAGCHVGGGGGGGGEKKVLL